MGILLVVAGVLAFLAAGPVGRKLGEQRAAAVVKGTDAAERSTGRMVPTLLRVGGAAGVLIGLITTVAGLPTPKTWAR